MRLNRLVFTAGLTILMLLLSSCGNKPTQEMTHDMSLKLSLLPITDVLPFYVAQNKGYFEDEGVQVEVVNVDSANNQATLMQAGEVDGMLTDLQTVALFNREKPSLQIVIKARKAYPDFPHFRIVAGPGVVITGPEDLVGVPVGISQNTIIQYLNDRLLTAWGVPEDGIAVEHIPAIPNRFEMLMSGQLKVALLPDPLAQAAIVAGGSLVVDDTQFTEYSQSIIAFHVDTLANKPDAVQAFVKGWNKAVIDINKDPNSYRDVLNEKTRVPPPVQGTYNLPKFPENEITSETEWADVIEWMQKKELLDKPVAYEDSVNNKFVK